jgi:hypothetical protein
MENVMRKKWKIYQININKTHNHQQGGKLEKLKNDDKCERKKMVLESKKKKIKIQIIKLT